jgi:ribosomal protein S18 acetylase RimI-like enzyme
VSLVIRPYRQADYERALAICIAAFAPIHQGFEDVLGAKIFDLQYRDWQQQYAETLSGISASGEDTKVYVAELDGAVAGFVFTRIDAKRKTGEIGLNAVDPNIQGNGIGKAMYGFALADLKARGAEIAYVGTAGDEAHAPARSAYEAVGFDKAIPGLHMFKVL